MRSSEVWSLRDDNNKGLLHGYEWGLRFGGLELRFG